MTTTILDGETYTEALQRRYAEEAKTDERMNIIELAKEAGAEPNYILLKCEALERFAALVRAEREWVELTDYEIVRMYAESPMCDSEMIDFARAVIAAFKEKNK